MEIKIDKKYRIEELDKHKIHRVIKANGGAKYPFNKLKKIGWSFYVENVKIGTLESCAINWSYRRDFKTRFKVVGEKNGCRIFRTR